MPSKKIQPAAPNWVPLDVAAGHLSTSWWTIRRRVADGTLKGRRFGRGIRVDLNEVDQLLRPIPTVSGDAA